ncbi:MAG TPA: GTPase, partial [Propionibacteriaceae bacterium]|nr:GTPase [Propionibacteriaceae bacterium]
MHQDRIVIVGAAGRDVHTFNVLYRDDPSVHVVAFTTSRLPAGRIASLPMALAGPRYPNGVPFVPMAHFEAVLADSAVDSVVYVDSNV